MGRPRARTVFTTGTQIGRAFVTAVRATVVPSLRAGSHFLLISYRYFHFFSFAFVYAAQRSSKKTQPKMAVVGVRLKSQHEQSQNSISCRCTRRKLWPKDDVNIGVRKRLPRAEGENFIPQVGSFRYVKKRSRWKTIHLRDSGKLGLRRCACRETL